MTRHLDSDAHIRPVALPQDLAALTRMWREVGWIDDEHGEAVVPHFFNCGHTLVAELAGAAECAVHTAPGTMRLLHTDLPLSAVTAVTTSRVARGHAFAQRLTALQLVYGAQQGAAVSALGMFDQGFYDRLGYATGAYEHHFVIDPGTLRVSSAVPTPERLEPTDYQAMHQAMVRRPLGHGSVVLEPAILSRAEFGFEEGDFGLGYRTDGELSHFVWMGAEEGEHGPYAVRVLCYQNSAQLLELLGLLKSLADQIYSISLAEPRELQLQAILQRPFRQRDITDMSAHANEQTAEAWWQFRVLDVPRCVAALQCAESVAFQLDVTDPLTELLPTEQPWRGVAGSYQVQLGPRSTASMSPTSDLPVVRCSVAALSRLLWGIVPASTIALAEDLQAPDALIAQLDQIIRLPRAVTGWDF